MGDCTKLSGDVNLVATGVAKDCTEEDLKEFLAGKGIMVVEVEKLTKPEVVDLVRTITFRVAVKAADYEAALRPECWPYRVGVRHYRAPRRPDRADGGWLGQSKHTGGNINPSSHGRVGRSGQGIVAGHNVGVGQVHQGATQGQHLPPGHPGRITSPQQQMGLIQPGPVELSNFWNVLQTLGAHGGDLGMMNHP